MKILLRVLRVFAGLLLVAAAVLGVMLWRSVPPLGGSGRISGLGNEVTVTFNANGVPWISARSDADAMRALGYLHARDRLWQMEMLRHAALGRLAEMLGSAGIASDRYLRTLDIAHQADLIAAMIPAETRALLEAYSEGVNAGIAGAPGGRPLELRILRHRPEAWLPLHSIAIARLQAWDLASGASSELERARAAAVVGPERLAELFPVHAESGAVILPPGSGSWSGRAEPGSGGRSRERTSIEPLPGALLAGAGAAAHEVPGLAARLLAGLSFARASNSWVIGPARTASGKPILANDPHLELRAPSIWYLAAIESPGLHVAGATIAGLPGVILGRNRSIAWGLTNLEIDDVDYAIERLSADSSQVLSVEGWVPIEVVRDSIVVRGRATVPFTLRRTPRGTLVASRPGILGEGDSGEVRALSMRWTAQEPSDELTALLHVARAVNWQEFLEAVALWKVPEQNWIYADVEGNIGYTASGRVPVRHGGNGRLPTRGWTGEGVWDRYLTFEELPRAFNPPEGFIVTANNRVIGPEYPHPFEADFALSWRADRIRELILAGSSLTAADVRRMQLDTLDVFARRARGIAAAAAARAGRDDLAQRLTAWDGTMGSDRTEPSLFWTWYRALQRLTFEDDFPRGLYAPAGPFQAWLFAGSSPWFDDTRTPEVEDLAALAARAMTEALPHADTRWGEIHSSLSEHVLADVPVLDRLLRLSVGPRSRAGSGYTVNVAGFGWSPPFTNSHAASLRHVVDLGAMEQGTMVLTTGQSGHPLSRRYRDQVDMWWDGRQLAVPLTAPGGGKVLRLRAER